MKLISYTEAAQILGIKLDTLYQAVEPSRGVLTKAGRRGSNGLLCEEQVRLFLGDNPRTGRKKRLSLNALTIEERALWQKYANEASKLAQETQQQGTLDINLIDARIEQKIQQSRSQETIDVLNAITSFIRNGVPQGDFFSNHPVLAAITYSLLVVVSIAGAAMMFYDLAPSDRKEVMAYLETLDASLESVEKSPNPPVTVNLSEIREKRKRIAQFREKVAV
jgi:hypothetical protein